MTRPLLLVAALLVTAALPPTATHAAGQRPSLDRVEELTQLGRPDEARDLLIAWFESEADDASRRDVQRGLWLRARLTVDPVQAELDFQRLVVLYPRGPYTPQAILRLAQASHAMGDGEAARRHVESLARDFPDSPVAEEARAWFRSAGPAPESPRAVEEATPSREQGGYSVQLGAFSEEERARALFEEVSEAGIEVRLVRVEGSDFLHVRHGRFVERQDAVAAMELLTAQGISAALVRDDRRETPVGN